MKDFFRVLAHKQLEMSNVFELRIIGELDLYRDPSILIINNIIDLRPIVISPVAIYRDFFFRLASNLSQFFPISIH
jgi:hypothetical protein